MNPSQDNPYEAAESKAEDRSRRSKSPTLLFCLGMVLEISGFASILFGALLPRFANTAAPPSLLTFTIACLYIGGAALAVLGAIAISACVWLNRIRRT